MRGRLIGAVLVAFAATTAFADNPGRRSGGGRSGAGHPSGGGAAVRSSGGGAAVRSSGGSHAVGRNSAGRTYVGRGSGTRVTGAESRHPVAGTGHGSRYYGSRYYGSRYYGNRYYGGGYYGRYGGAYYGRGYPYYGSYGYYPYYRPYGYGGYWGSGLSVGLYYGAGYASSAPYYPAYSGAYPVTSYYAYDPAPEDVDPAYARPEEPRQPGSGELRLDVRPDDATVYVDDQFLGTARQLATLSLAPGPHRIEVVRPGFRTLERTVLVKPDAPMTVVVELERQ